MLVDLPQNGIPLFPTFLKYHIQDQLDYIGEDDIINLTGVNALYFWVYSMLYCVQRILSENIVRIAYSIPCRFPSLKILRFISANTKELWKNYLRLKALILIRNFDAHWNFGILIKKLSVRYNDCRKLKKSFIKIPTILLMNSVTSVNQGKCRRLRDHLFSMYTKFSEKLTFPNVRVRIRG